MSDSDDREDVAWLLARERGQPNSSLSAEKVTRYTQLEGLIVDLQDTPVAPPEGWEHRMLAALEAAAPEPDAGDAAAPVAFDPSRSRRRWMMPVAVAAAAAALAIVLVVRMPSAPEDPQIAMIVEPTGPNRGAHPSVGDTLVVRATIHGDGELRIYDQAGEQARCAAPGSGCRIERERGQTTLVLTFTVRSASTLRAVLFYPALGTPPASMDADVATAERANVMVMSREPVRFR